MTAPFKSKLDLTFENIVLAQGVWPGFREGSSTRASPAAGLSSMTA